MNMQEEQNMNARETVLTARQLNKCIPAFNIPHLPMLKPMIILMLLMSIGRIFNSDFGLFYQVPLGNGLLSSTTQTIDTYVYRALLELNNVSMSSAASVFQAVIGFVLVLASNLLVSVVEPDNALF